MLLKCVQSWKNAVHEKPSIWRNFRSVHVPGKLSKITLIFSEQQWKFVGLWAWYGLIPGVIILASPAGFGDDKYPLGGNLNDRNAIVISAIWYQLFMDKNEAYITLAVSVLAFCFSWRNEKCVFWCFISVVFSQLAPKSVWYSKRSLLGNSFKSSIVFPYRVQYLIAHRFNWRLRQFIGQFLTGAVRTCPERKLKRFLWKNYWTEIRYYFGRKCVQKRRKIPYLADKQKDTKSPFINTISPALIFDLQIIIRSTHWEWFKIYIYNSVWPGVYWNFAKELTEVSFWLYEYICFMYSSFCLVLYWLFNTLW